MFPKAMPKLMHVTTAIKYSMIENISIFISVYIPVNEITNVGFVTEHL